MRYATATEDDLLQWGIQEIELREADIELSRTPKDCEERKRLRAQRIGATINQANTLCRDAQLFLRRKGMKA